MKKRVLAVILVSVLTNGMVGCADKSKEKRKNVQKKCNA